MKGVGEQKCAVKATQTWKGNCLTIDYKMTMSLSKQKVHYKDWQEFVEH